VGVGLQLDKIVSDSDRLMPAHYQTTTTTSVTRSIWRRHPRNSRRRQTDTPSTWFCRDCGPFIADKYRYTPFIYAVPASQQFHLSRRTHYLFSDAADLMEIVVQSVRLFLSRTAEYVKERSHHSSLLISSALQLSSDEMKSVM